MTRVDMILASQLKGIKNKKVRHFYEEQNNRLNDWLEVDAIVMALADDVLDSMDPDRDNDGRRERTGGLQELGGTIWDFLPEEEKKNREASQKKAKWAININVIANIILLIAKVSRVWRIRVFDSRLTKPLDYCCILFRLLVPHCVSNRLCPRSSLHPHCVVHQSSCTMAPQVSQQEVSRRSSQIGTTWDLGLFHHHGHFLYPDSARIRDEATSRCTA